MGGWQQALLRLAVRARLDRLAYRLWRYNPKGLYRLYQHHRFDRRYRVQTRGYGDLRYEPTPAPVLPRILNELELDWSEFVFIDVGSGKGKVLLLASAYPFKKIIGIERYGDLHLIAVENLRAYPMEARRCQDIQSIHLDAADYTIPADPLLIYFFNPFPETILSRVLSNIERSVAKTPRAVFLVYYAPILKRGMPWDRRGIFDRSALFEVVREAGDFTIYRARAGGASLAAAE